MALVGFACAYHMWSSAIYHLYNPMGEHECQKLLAFDMSGIIAMMLATFVVLIFYLFAEWVEARLLLLTVMIPLLISNLVVILLPAC